MSVRSDSQLGKAVLHLIFLDVNFVTELKENSR